MQGFPNDSLRLSIQLSKTFRGVRLVAQIDFSYNSAISSIELLERFYGFIATLVLLTKLQSLLNAEGGASEGKGKEDKKLQEALSGFLALSISLKSTSVSFEGYLSELALLLTTRLPFAKTLDEGSLAETTMAQKIRDCLIEYALGSLERHSTPNLQERSITILKELIERSSKRKRSSNLMCPSIDSITWKTDSEISETLRKRRRHRASNEAKRSVVTSKRYSTNKRVGHSLHQSFGFLRCLEVCISRIRAQQSHFLKQMRRSFSSPDSEENDDDGTLLHSETYPPEIMQQSQSFDSMNSSMYRSTHLLEQGLKNTVSILSYLTRLRSEMQTVVLSEIVPTACNLLKHTFILHGMLLDSSTAEPSRSGAQFSWSGLSLLSTRVKEVVKETMKLIHSCCSPGEDYTTGSENKFYGNHIYNNVHQFISQCYLDRFLKVKTSYYAQMVRTAFLRGGGQQGAERYQLQRTHSREAWSTLPICASKGSFPYSTGGGLETGNSAESMAASGDTKSLSDDLSTTHLDKRAKQEITAEIGLHLHLLPFCLESLTNILASARRANSAGSSPLQDSRNQYAHHHRHHDHKPSLGWKFLIGSCEMDICEVLPPHTRLHQFLTTSFARDPVGFKSELLNKFLLLICFFVLVDSKKWPLEHHLLNARASNNPRVGSRSSKQQQQLSAGTASEFPSVYSVVVSGLMSIIDAVKPDGAVSAKLSSGVSDVIQGFVRTNFTFGHMDIVLATVAKLHRSELLDAVRVCNHRLLISLMEDPTLNAKNRLERYVVFSLLTDDGRWPVKLDANPLSLLATLVSTQTPKGPQSAAVSEAASDTKLRGVEVSSQF
eukprot:jgi/Bigna1/141116/aug1.60_g15824